VPLKVFNDSAITLVVHSVVVSTVSPACGPGGTSASVGIAIPQGDIITINPLLPGNATVEWSVAKITSLSGTTGIGAIHPYFTCFGTSSSYGFPVLTDYWYPLGASPFQVLKIY